MDVAKYKQKLKHNPLAGAPKVPTDDNQFVLFKQFEEVGIPKYSRVHLRRLMRAGLFPSAVQLSPNRVGWLLSELEGWKEERLNAGRFTPP